MYLENFIQIDFDENIRTNIKYQDIRENKTNQIEEDASLLREFFKQEKVVTLYNEASGKTRSVIHRMRCILFHDALSRNGFSDMR
jgi:hypothetical protein